MERVTLPAGMWPQLREFILTLPADAFGKTPVSALPAVLAAIQNAEVETVEECGDT